VRGPPMNADSPSQHPSSVDPFLEETPPDIDRPVSNHSVSRKFASGAAWTLGGYGLAQAIRFATSVAVTRLLAPELFGIMLIVNMVRTGAELLSDIGIGQSVVRSPRGEQPAFYNTAWTLQIWRGFALFVLCALLALPVSAIYEIPELVYVLPAAGSTLLISGLTSMALPILRRRMSFPRLAVFEVVTALLFAVFQVAIAFIYPTIWALVIGLVFGSLVTVAASYGLEKFRHGFKIDRDCVSEILSFGKWITASSAIYFITMNLDRMYFPTVLTLEVLGVFAIARTISEIVSTVFLRLNTSILFPHIAAEASRPRTALRSSISTLRQGFLIASAVAVGLLAATADLLVVAVFDTRYHSAGWMASFLTVGVWFAILASTAESSLLGLGRPQTATYANSAKLVWLVVALPLAFGAHGMVAAILAIAASDMVRYVATVPEQRHAGFSFLLQDAAATATFFAIIGLVALARVWLELSFLL
jgi:O-antigen/teichoic acid export membrane protein